MTFFLFLSVREKLVCMSQNDQRKREREIKVFLWGYIFPIAPMPVSGPIKEKILFACESRVLPVVASVVCGLFFLVTVL